MKQFSFLGLPQSVAELHRKLDNIHKLLLAPEDGLKNPPDPDPDWDFFHSISEVADFFEVPYSTARGWYRSGRIKGIKGRLNVKFYIPDVLAAIANDDIIGYYATRLSEKYPPAEEKKQPLKEPEIFIETELFPNRFFFIRLKYQGWKTTVVCIPEIWDNQDDIRALVYEVILAQHDRKPFRIAPIF